MTVANCSPRRLERGVVEWETVPIEGTQYSAGWKRSSCQAQQGLAQVSLRRSVGKDDEVNSL